MASRYLSKMGQSWRSAAAGLIVIASVAACGAEPSLSEGAEGGTGSGGRGSGGAWPGGASSAGDAGGDAAGGSIGVQGGAGGEPANGGGNGAASGVSGAAGGEGGPQGNAEREIELTELDINLNSRAATAKITLSPSATVGASFDAQTLTIRSVTMNGAPLPYSVNSLGVLEVSVPPADEALVVVIEYGFRFDTSGHGISPGGYTLTWPYYCGEVFPCHPNPVDGTRFKLHVAGQTQPIVYPSEITSEAPSYMLAWIQGDYTNVELGTTSAGTSVSSRHLPGGEADASLGTAHLVQAFDWLEQHLGPYRFGSNVGPVAADWGPKSLGGMEHHPYWHIAKGSFGDEVVHVHEAAHGWFGNAIRLACWEDFVLSEGTATYLAARVLEEVTGSDATWARYETDLDSRRATGNRIAWYPDGCNQIDVVSSGLFNRMVYLKGAFFLRALEQRVGRAPFDEALRTFYERFTGRAARVQDLLDVVREVTSFDPQSCAESWLATRPIPSLAPCP